MRIAKLFLGESISPPQGNLVGRVPAIVPPDQATSTSPFLILETPIRSLSPVAFMFAPDGKGGGYFNSLLIQMPSNLKDAVESTGVIDPNAVEVEHPPLALQLVLKHATRYWQPFLQRRVPIEELTKTWSESPSIYKMYVDKRKSPGIVTKQNT